MAVSDFTISVPEERLAWIARRLAEYEWHEAPARGGWTDGTNKEVLQDLCAYWADGYDWRAIERHLNRLTHFTAPVPVGDETLPIHFIHLKSPKPDAMPLILSHGWPGSFYEFDAIAEALAQDFHVVIPSLPGYAFSGKPANPIGPRATAHAFNALMTGTLGYPRYFAQGGDWGSMVTSWLGAEHEACAAIHLNMMGFNKGAPSADQSDEEKQWRQKTRVGMDLEGAYFRLQSTKAQTLSYAMMDSPVGQAAWILEKFKTWSHLDREDLYSAYTKDQLLTNIMLYVATGSFNTASWMYRGFIEEMMAGAANTPRVEVPTGVGNFPYDSIFSWPPRAVVERNYAVAHWTDVGEGGHFAAMERPSLFLADVRTFFTSLA